MIPIKLSNILFSTFSTFPVGVAIVVVVEFEVVVTIVAVVLVIAVLLVEFDVVCTLIDETICSVFLISMVSICMFFFTVSYFSDITIFLLG